MDARRAADFHRRAVENLRFAQITGWNARRQGSARAFRRSTTSIWRCAAARLSASSASSAAGKRRLTVASRAAPRRAADTSASKARISAPCARRTTGLRRARPDDLPGSLQFAQPAHDGAPDAARSGARSLDAAKADITARIEELLGLVRLPAEAAERNPHEFSGGQRQRIGIARALAVEPEVLVADELVSALDVSVQAQVINLLLQLQERLQLTVVFVAHDFSLVRHISHRVAVMYLGKVVEVSPPRRCLRRPGILIPRRCWPLLLSLIRRDEHGWRQPAGNCPIHSICRLAAFSTRAVRSRSSAVLPSARSCRAGDLVTWLPVTWPSSACRRPKSRRLQTPPDGRIPSRTMRNQR